MTRNFILLIGTLLLLLWVCEKKMDNNKGFFSPVEISSEGITILEINSNVRFLNLAGKINLTEGVIEMKLINPNDKALFAFRIHSNDPVSIKPYPSPCSFLKFK